MNVMRIYKTARTVIAAGVLLHGSLPIFAANDAAPRITKPIDEQQRVTLTGNVLPFARAEFDQGAVDSGTPLARMQLILKRSDEQDAELKQLIDEQHAQGSTNFHRWLTPTEFGERFGVGTADLQQVTAWLQSKGFNVEPVSKGRITLEFSGTAGQLKAAFTTEIHTYLRNGKTMHANSSDPTIPAALAPVIQGIASLNDMKPKSDLKVMGQAKLDPHTHLATPTWNPPLPSGACPSSTNGVCPYYAPTPADMAVQYNTAPLLAAGTNGAGYKIGILSASNVDPGVVANYRYIFGLPPQAPNVIIDGNDPGQTYALEETYLDLEVAAAMAPGASIYMYTGADTLLTNGLQNAIARAVNDDVADILSLSYGSCESDMGSSGNMFFYSYWQQASAQGQSVFVAAGDGGSAGCDDFDLQTAAEDGLAVSGYASTPYDTAVGGTDFYYSSYAQGYASSAVQGQFAQYWGTSTTGYPTASLLSTLPEQVWNDSLGLNVFSGAAGTNIVAGSGGASSCAYGSGINLYTGGYAKCISGYPKPGWQIGTGVPNDGVRDLPDISLFAANGGNYSFWPICAGPYDCSSYRFGGTQTIFFSAVGGTSSSAPATAGIMALVDQAMGGRQGLANFYLYPLAKTSAFNDITVGSNNVVCISGTPNCSRDTNGDGFYSLQKYSATVGYDQASGLGTPNVANLIKNWGSVRFNGTTTSLSLSPATAVHGAGLTVNTTVTAPSGIPTGTVALTTNSGVVGGTGIGTSVLKNGSASSTVYNLPGGSYEVTGTYSGDGTFAESSSSPATVTITPENSATNFVAAGQSLSGNYFNLVNGGTYSFGSIFAIDAQVAGTSGYGQPTGAITFKDNASVIGTSALNSAASIGQGPSAAEEFTSNFAPGTHSVVASYPGDPSFNASNSSPLTFTIVKGTPQIYLDDSSSSVPLYAGQTFQVPVVLAGTVSGGTGPTGVITVTFAGITQTVTVSQGLIYGQAISTGTVSFPNISPGSYTLTASYSGDSNYTAVNAAPKHVTVSSLGNLIPTSTAITASTTGFSTSTVLVLSASVTAADGSIPSGNVYFYSNGLIFAPSLTSSSAVALDATGKASITITSTASLTMDRIFNGSNSITAEYVGNKTYASSESTPVLVSGSVGDFTIATRQPVVTLTSSQPSTTSNLQVVSLSGLGGTVNLSCTPSSPLVLCAIQGSNAITLPTDGTAVSVPVVFNSQTQTAALRRSIEPRKGRLDHGGVMLAGGSVTLALLCFFFPARRRLSTKLLLLLCAASLAFGITGCSHSNSGPKFSTAPAGTYTAVITATDGNLSHSIKVTLVVQ